MQAEENRKFMHRRNLIIWAAWAALLSCQTAGFAERAWQDRPYRPRVGQEGKDVIWVPTPTLLAEAMLDLAKVTPADFVIDLGSGDGRIVIAAARRRARALGIEYNPDLVNLSIRNAEQEGVSARAQFSRGDLFQTDFRQATVLTMYLSAELNLKLRPQILAMKPGTRVLSHAFPMEDWEADRILELGGRTVYFWIVPARVAGSWTMETDSGKTELTLRQSFQKIEGTLSSNGESLPLKNGKLSGARITFAAGATAGTTRSFTGTVTGDRIQGTASTGKGPATNWTATRQPWPELFMKE